MTAKIRWNTHRAEEEDLEDIVRIHQESRAEAMPFLPQPPPLEETLEYFQNQVLPKTFTLVSTISESPDSEDIGKIAGFISIKGRPRPFIDHLYIAPKYWRQGLGKHLLGLAMRSSPTLDLYCFQKNEMARVFYETHGFHISQMTDGAENMEKEPDILYRWIREYHKWSDAEYIQIFESLNLPIYEWTHRAHVRMAWIYLSIYPYSKALNKIRTGIKRFNNKNGFFGGYHETVTRAYAILILNRIQNAAPYDNFADFISANPILISKKTPTAPYYSHAYLWSEEGRDSFLPPDLANLPIIAS